jgi:folate-binding protein YgfZ
MASIHAPTAQAGPAPSLLASDVLCDLAPLAVLEIAGADAATFLQGQFSNDVRDLSPTTWQHTSYNSPKGRMLATLVLWGDEGGFRALLPADIADPVRKRLAMYVLRSRVTVSDRTDMYTRLGLAGPTAAVIVREVWRDAPARGAVLRAGATCVLGLEHDRFVVVTPPEDAPALRSRFTTHAQTADFTTWEWLTLRAGIPVITRATQDLLVAQAANLDALGGISFEKGCYTGQEIIARTQYLGRLKERLSVWHADAHAIAAGTRLYSAVFGDQACGTVVNAAQSPNGGIDLVAVVQTAAVEAGDVRLGSLEGPQLQRLPLPYALPAPSAPSRRVL